MPALYLQVCQAFLAEGLDEGGGKTGIGNERRVVVDGSTTDAVAVGQFALGVISLECSQRGQTCGRQSSVSRLACRSARSFDTSNYSVGQRIHFPMATGKKVEMQTLIYRGKEDWKANDKNTYRCLVFSLLDYEEKTKEKELLRFYVTDDQRHLPIRIDFYLKFGTAKAFFASEKK